MELNRVQNVHIYHNCIGPPPENITVNTSSSTSLLVEWNPSSVTQIDLIGYLVMFREELGGELANTIVLDQSNIQNRYN